MKQPSLGWILFFPLFCHPTVGVTADLKLGKYSVVNIQQVEPTNTEKKLNPVEAKQCENFLVTESQIRKFLSSAEIIDGNRWHYDYDDGICEITADIVTQDKVFQIRIDKGLFGWLHKGSEEIILGCKEKGPRDPETGAIDHEQCF